MLHNAMERVVGDVKFVEKKVYKSVWVNIINISSVKFQG